MNRNEKSYRIRQMRRDAHRNKKAVPTAEALEKLAELVASDGMKCPACRRAMNWLFKDGRSTVVTLQHDRSGVIRLICKGCNSRHHLHPADTFYDLPEGHKRCPRCEAVKPVDAFYRLATGEIVSACRECERRSQLARYHRSPEAKRAKHQEWLKANREKVKEQRRKYQELNRARLTKQERLRRERKKAS